MHTTHKSLEKKRAKIQILSPVHIGSGETLSAGEILTSKKSEKDNYYYFYRPDIQKIVKNLTEKGQLRRFYDELSSQIINPSVEKSEFLKNLFKNNYLYKLKLYGNTNSKRKYKIHLKTLNKVYIPGSSIKGAILTAIYNHAIKEIALKYKSKRFLDLFVELLTQKENYYEKKRKKYNPSLQSIVFGWIKYGDEIKNKLENNTPLKKEVFNQWLLVTDTNLASPSEFLDVRLLERKGKNPSTAKSTNQSESKSQNLGNKTKEDISFFAECIRNQKIFEFEFQEQPDSHLQLEEILEIADKHYREVLEREKKWWEKHGEGITIRFPTIDNNKFLLRIGFGSGLYSTSIVPSAYFIAEKAGLNNDFMDKYAERWKLTREKKPEEETKWVTRDVSNEGKYIYHPMGWVAIDIEE